MNFIEQFQSYRNSLVHINYEFGQADLVDLNDDIIYVVVHLVKKLLAGEDDRPAEFYKGLMSKDAFRTLLACKPYIEAMEYLAKKESDFVYTCIECGNRTFAVEAHRCYACDEDFEDMAASADCPFCQSRESVLYDKLNIRHNNNRIRGKCLACDTKCTVFECPKCDQAFVVERTKKEDRCTSDRCLWS